MNNVIWEVTLSDKSFVVGNTEDGSWTKFQEMVNLKDNSIVLYSISKNDNRKGVSHRDGYFLANKLITIMSGDQLELVGFGSYRKTDGEVKIAWLRKTDLSFYEAESRKPEQCGKSLIINKNGN